MFIIREVKDPKTLSLFRDFEILQKDQIPNQFFVSLCDHQPMMFENIWPQTCSRQKPRESDLTGNLMLSILTIGVRHHTSSFFLSDEVLILGRYTLNSVYCKPLYLHSLNFTSTLGAIVACCVSKCHDGVCMAITSIHYFLNFNYSCKSFGYGNQIFLH